MDLQKAIVERVSVRKFKSDKVEIDLIKKIVEMAGKAPSINNSQPWKFIAVTNKEIIDKMADLVNKKIDKVFPDSHPKSAQIKSQVQSFSTFFVDAPVIIVVLQRPYEAVVDKILPEEGIDHNEINKMRNFPNIQTIGGAIQNMLLTAVDAGLGGCWLTGPNIAARDLEKLLDIEEPFTISACVAIGYPEGNTAPRAKKSLDEIFELID
ncbi:MAG: nitroreductase [Melioribacteraceae bacterium]|nr:MAG: nitroreductase [Melioribacteraceae bacterium]